MASITDWAGIVAGKRDGVVTVPHVSLEGFKFRLLDVCLAKKWIETGEVKPDGRPKYTCSETPQVDETGERVRVELSLQLIDAGGTQTSAAAAFVDRSQYVDKQMLQALVDACGGEVQLKGARVEFRDKGVKADRFGRVKTEMRFAFDRIELPEDDNE